MKAQTHSLFMETSLFSFCLGKNFALPLGIRLITPPPLHSNIKVFNTYRIKYSTETRFVKPPLSVGYLQNPDILPLWDTPISFINYI